MNSTQINKIIENIKIVSINEEFKELLDFITKHTRRQEYNKLLYKLQEIKSAYNSRPPGFPVSMTPVSLTRNYHALVPSVTTARTFQDLPPSTLLPNGSVYQTPEGKYRLRNPLGYIIPATTTLIHNNDGTFKPCGIIQSQQTLTDKERIKRLERQFKNGNISYDLLR